MPPASKFVGSVMVKVLEPDSASVPAFTKTDPEVFIVPDSVVVPVPSLTRLVTMVSPVMPPAKVVLVPSDPKARTTSPPVVVIAMVPPVPDSESTFRLALSSASVPPFTTRSPMSRVVPKVSMSSVPLLTVVAPV